MNLMVTIGPGVAPMIGTALSETLGWRSILYVLSAFGLVNLVFCWKLLPETRALTSRSGNFLRHAVNLLRSPAFLGYAIGGGCATTAVYAFVAAAPFIFVHQLHRPSHEVAIYLALLVLGMWVGSATCSRLIGRVALEKLLVRGNLLSAVSAFAFLATVLTGHLSVAAMMGCMFGFAVGLGLASPAALTQAMSVNPQAIGSASGLFGFIQMAVGALCTAAGGLGSNPALTVAIVLSVAGIVAQGSFWMALRRQNA